VLVTAEADGCVRLAHVATNDRATLKRFADGQVAPNARAVTDGLASYEMKASPLSSHHSITSSRP
jgi:hypothetical protein